MGREFFPYSDSTLIEILYIAMFIMYLNQTSNPA